MFFETQFLKREGMRAERVTAIVEEHRAGIRNHSDLLWNLVNLELRHRIFVDRTLAPKR
jgi:hypothetical protein